MKAISLFSGCMGLDLGMEKAGIHTEVCVEKDAASKKTIQLNCPRMILFDDVFMVTGEQLIKAARGSVDVVMGGPPCQSFSVMGNRGGVEDPRGKALLEYVRLVDEIHAPFFILENVQGLLSAKIDDSSLINWLINKFQIMGYKVKYWLFNSYDFGAPQKRLRVIMIGSLNSDPIEPRPISDKKLTLRDAIYDISDPNPVECGKFSRRMALFLCKIPAGGDWRYLNKKDQDIVMGKTDRSNGGHTSFLRRLSYDLPCPTLVTSPTQRATTLCHPEYTRPLSVAEYQRVQEFPDEWELDGTVTEKYRQLGNAVPVRLAEAVGHAICN